MKKIIAYLLILSLFISSSMATGYHTNASFTTLSNNEKKLSAYEGNILVIEYIQTTCPHCRDEGHRSNMNDLYNVYSDEVSFLMLTISDQDSKKDMQDFINQFGISWDAGLDSNDAVRSEYGVSSTPTTQVLNENGKLLKSWSGHKSFSTYTDFINHYVDDPYTPQTNENEENGFLGGGDDGSTSVIGQVFSSPLFQMFLGLTLLIMFYAKFMGKSQNVE